MLSAIGPSPSSGPTGNPPTQGLDVQLNQYQNQLADLVSCPSCKTPAGQAKILDLSRRISQLERRIAAGDGSGTPPPTTQGHQPAGKEQAWAKSPASVGESLGVNLDVYA